MKFLMPSRQNLKPLDRHRPTQARPPAGFFMEKQMQEITAFKASDGRIFETSSEAEAYEFQLSWDERVEKFMSSSLCPYPSGAHRAMIQKTIVAWEAYKDGRGSLSYQKTAIQDSGLAQRTCNCLLAEGILYVEDAQDLSNNELLKIPNLGRKSVAEIRNWKKA